MASASFFRLLGVQPILGRTFFATDDLLGAAPVVLISEDFWKRKFDSSPTAIGQALTLKGDVISIAASPNKGTGATLARLKPGGRPRSSSAEGRLPTSRATLQPARKG